MIDKKGSSFENPFDNIQDAYDASHNHTGKPRTFFVNAPSLGWFFDNLYEANPSKLSRFIYWIKRKCLKK